MQASWFRHYLPHLLTGLALTILLLFLLSNWLGVPALPSETRTPSNELNVWAQPLDVDGQGMVLRQPDQLSADVSAAKPPSKTTDQVVIEQEQTKSQQAQAASSLQAVHIPKDIRLSAEELADLSPEARERYQVMRAELVELREQALELQREREAVEQRMLEMEHRNQELSESLQAQPALSEE